MTRRVAPSPFRLTTMMAAITALGALTACTEGADKIVFDTALGPKTEAQAKELPNDLRGATTGVVRGPEKTGDKLQQEDPSGSD